MYRPIVLLLAGLALLCVSPVFAQDAVLGQKYGFGVQAYFAGDYEKAFAQLQSAIKGGSTDPRAFYYRGLACLKLGRAKDATDDFRKGADLESRDTNKFYNVAKSLERVQGAPRVELEKYRVDARMAALEEAERMRKARYEAIKRDEQRVLRQQAIPTSTEPAAGAETAGQPAADTDIFASPDDKDATAADKKAAKTPPVKKAPADAKKKPGETAPAAEENPFGAPAGDKPAPAKPAEKKDEANPFGA